MKNVLCCLTLLFSVLVLQFAISGSAAAQTPCITYETNGCNIGVYAFGPCPGDFNCVSAGTLLLTCQAMLGSCPPVAGPIETCPTCGAGSGGAGGSPAGGGGGGGGSPAGGGSGGGLISFSSGNTFIKETDVRLPGLSGGLTLLRTWNSLWPSTQTTFQIGLFGPNWRSNFEERVFVGSDNYIKYARGDGSFWSFGVGGPQFIVAAPANAGATMVANFSNWTVAFLNGEQRVFDYTSGHLLQIIDRNGNVTQLSYNAVGLLATVTDPVSRTLSFTYGNPTYPALVTSVTSSAGVSLSYAYDTQGRLIQVTEPDQSTISFTYNSQSLITSVTDTNGVILESHTYDTSGRGLTSSRANGVAALSISYPN
jgi:YD repeat-containing protein